ncbi:hypothetical protein CRYUN_Cryun15aG0132200 [Craigia yunnanensis]
MCSAATYLILIDARGLMGEYLLLLSTTFRRSMISLLNAYYNNLEGYYSTNFPDKPEKVYDFVNEARNNIGVDTQPAIGTQFSVLYNGWAVQAIFLDTGTVGTENHPIHLHDFSFYLLGTDRARQF